MTTTTTNTKTLYEFAESATGIAIRARHEKNPSDILTQLQNMGYNDQTARNAPIIAEREAEHRTAHEEHRATADTLRAYSNRIRITDEARAEAYTEARHHATEAENNRRTAEALSAELDRTFSDRADLVQSALLALVELANRRPEPTLVLCNLGNISAWRARATKSALHSAVTIAKLTNNADLLDGIRAEAWKTTTNSAGKAINQLASPDALNRTTTRATKATPEEVQAWIAKHGDTGKSIREPQPRKRTSASDCFDTMEFKTYKSNPSATGFYRVRHWVTVAPYQSIDQLNENGDITGYFKSYNPFEQSQGTAERLEALATSAQLTDRERQFVAYFTSTTASTKGAEARRAYHASTTANTDTKQAREAANNAEYQAMVNYALERIGIIGKVNKDNFFRRLKARLATAYTPEHTAITRAEADEAERRAWATLQANRHRGHHTDTRTATDLLEWTNTASTNTAPVIHWLTADEATERREATRATEPSHIDNTTPSARAKAREAQKRYKAKHEAIARAMAEQAQAQAKADRLSKARAEAIRHGVCVQSTTWELWKNWSEAQRTAYLEYLNARTA